MIEPDEPRDPLPLPEATATAMNSQYMQHPGAKVKQGFFGHLGMHNVIIEYRYHPS